MVIYLSLLGSESTRISFDLKCFAIKAYHFVKETREHFDWVGLSCWFADNLQEY